MTVPSFSSHTPAIKGASVRRGVDYWCAKEFTDLRKAFGLVADNYRQVGLQSPESGPLRVTKYHLLPSTKVFVAGVSEDGYKGASNIVATISVLQDSTLGFPLEDLASAEIAEFRRSGRRLAEFIGVATDPHGASHFSIFKLFWLALMYCRRSGVDAILAGITQRHIEFFRKLLCFRPIADSRPYGMGNNMLVQPHVLMIDEVEDLLAKRARSLDRDASWQEFQFNRSNEVLTEAGMALTWQRAWIEEAMRESAELRRQLDADVLMVLQREYSKFGTRLEVQT